MSLRLSTKYQSRGPSIKYVSILCHGFWLTPSPFQQSSALKKIESSSGFASLRIILHVCPKFCKKNNRPKNARFSKLEWLEPISILKIPTPWQQLGIFLQKKCWELRKNQYLMLVCPSLTGMTYLQFSLPECFFIT